MKGEGDLAPDFRIREAGAATCLAQGVPPAKGADRAALGRIDRVRVGSYNLICSGRPLVFVRNLRRMGVGGSRKEMGVC